METCFPFELRELLIVLIINLLNFECNVILHCNQMYLDLRIFKNLHWKTRQQYLWRISIFLQCVFSNFEMLLIQDIYLETILTYCVLFNLFLKFSVPGLKKSYIYFYKTCGNPEIIYMYIYLYGILTWDEMTPTCKMTLG